MEIGHQSAIGYQYFFLRIGPILVDLDIYWYRRNHAQINLGLFIDLGGICL